jgi:hypothetical protein
MSYIFSITGSLVVHINTIGIDRSLSWFQTSSKNEKNLFYCIFFKIEISGNLVSTTQIPREAPKQALFARRLFCILFGGILPFVCISIQVSLILNSIW